MFKLVRVMMKLLTLKKISSLSILITGGLSVVISLVTIYASQVGNFVVSVEPTPNIQMILSESKDFTEQSTRLSAKGIPNMTNITLSDIDVEEVVKKNGSSNSDTRYIAYNFYLKNMSDSVVNYRMTMQIDKVYRNVDSAIRVMLVTEMKESEIYAKPQEIEPNIGKPETEPYLTTAFSSPTVAFNHDIKNFREGQVIKYTVIVWLEGEDPQCTDDILGGSIKMSLRFSAYI